MKGRQIWWMLALLALALGSCVSGPMGSGGMMGSGHMGGMMGGGMMSAPAGPPPAVTPVATATPGGAATVSYSQDVQPLFDRNCVACHGGQMGLWLDSYERMLAGSQHGPVVVPGNPDASELIRRVTGISQPQMPFGQPPLSPGDVALLRRWIAEGAVKN